MCRTVYPYQRKRYLPGGSFTIRYVFWGVQVSMIGSVLRPGAGIPSECPLCFLEFADKVADIFKSAVQCDFRDGPCRPGKERACLLQPVEDQVLDRRYTGKHHYVEVT